MNHENHDSIFSSGIWMAEWHVEFGICEQGQTSYQSNKSKMIYVRVRVRKHFFHWKLYAQKILEINE